MKKTILALTLLLSAVAARADEGMWMITNLSARTDSIMQSLGLELTHDEIFSTEHASLNDAIVQFGGFCSGVVVSNDGLVFTNHHCGYGSIQEHSSTAHDYLRDGFVAKKQKDELPNEGLYVLFHLNTYEVTDRMLEAKAASQEMDDAARVAYMDSVMQEIISAVEDSTHCIEAGIVPFYKRSKYYVSIYQRYSDVRLVFAPPSCLGKHGGDTDNWMWPRQTCDFSVFRIYAGPNNQPADYSPSNVPYHPKRYATVSTQGYQPGTFCMTFGYPGSTDRYLSSYGIQQTIDCSNTPRIQVRGVKQEILTDAMNSSQALRIMYSSKYAQSSNYWKNAIGQNKALRDLDVIGEKQALEREMVAWNPYVQTILDSLQANYSRTNDAARAMTLWEESFYSGSDILQFAMSQLLGAMHEDSEGKDFQKAVEKAYKDIDVPTDKRVFAAMLQNYREQTTDPAFLPDFYAEIDSLLGGDCQKFADIVYDNSILCNPPLLKQASDISQLAEDPMVGIAIDCISTLYAIYGPDSIDEYERQLGDQLRLMNKDKEYYPDANFTLRMSYGTVQGYNDFTCFTPSQSIIDKYEKQGSNPDYDLTQPVYKWLKKGDWGKRYVDPNSEDLQLCFLTTNDITGGNSGSGMFDGKGRLIGLAFDGNWEAMSSDYKFDNALTRCIGVDIRYVLSVIEKYGKAKRIIKELRLE